MTMAKECSNVVGAGFRPAGGITLVMTVLVLALAGLQSAVARDLLGPGGETMSVSDPKVVKAAKHAVKVYGKDKKITLIKIVTAIRDESEIDGVVNDVFDLTLQVKVGGEVKTAVVFVDEGLVAMQIEGEHEKPEDGHATGGLMSPRIPTVDKPVNDKEVVKAADFAIKTIQEAIAEKLKTGKFSGPIIDSKLVDYVGKDRKLVLDRILKAQQWNGYPGEEGKYDYFLKARVKAGKASENVWIIVHREADRYTLGSCSDAEAEDPLPVKGKARKKK